MAGRRRFDEAAVLDRVAEVFREKGYAGASLDDLVAATGLKRGSLYNAYGSKEGLWLAAFERYGRVTEDALLEALDAPGLEAAIGALLARQVAAASAAARPCLIARGIAERTALPPAPAAAVEARHRATVARLAGRLRAAQDAGDLSPGTETAGLAEALAGHLRAISLLGAGPEGEGRAGAIAAAARRALGLEP